MLTFRPLWGKAAMCIAAIAILFTFGTPNANAQESADELIVSGVQLREQGRDEEALRVFQRAHELEPSTRTLAQMGLAEQALGDWVNAYIHLSEALRGNDEWITRTRAAIQGALDTVQQNVGRVEFRGGVDGAQIWVDGREVGAFPLDGPVPVRAGTVQLMIQAPGFIPLQRTLTVRAGSLSRETVSMAPDPNATRQNQTNTANGTQGNAGTQITDPGDDGGSSSPVPWILVGTGSAVALSAVVPYVMSFAKASKYNNDSCLEGGRTRDDNCGNLRDEAERLQLVSGILLGTGVAIGATGLILHFVMGDSGSEREPTAGTIRCGGGPGQLGAACELTF